MGRIVPVVPVSTDLECELLKAAGQPWKSLVSGSGLCDNGELGGWSGNISAGDLDALDIGVLVGVRGSARDGC